MPVLFPGSDAGASLKPDCQVRAMRLPRPLFPGSDAGASLKQRDHEGAGLRGVDSSPAVMPGPH